MSSSADGACFQKDVTRSRKTFNLSIQIFNKTVHDCSPFFRLQSYVGCKLTTLALCDGHAAQSVLKFHTRKRMVTLNLDTSTKKCTTFSRAWLLATLAARIDLVYPNCAEWRLRWQ